MTLARLPGDPPEVEPAPATGNVRFAPGASDAHSPSGGTAPGFSIATTAGLAAGTRRRNNAPSDASAETSFRIPLANTAGSAAAARDLSSLVGLVDFSEKLKNLDWGSWERLLPEGSSLGGDLTLLSEAPFTSYADAVSTLKHTAPNSIKRSSILLTGFYPKIIFTTFASSWPRSGRHPLMAPWLPLVRQSGTLFCRHRQRRSVFTKKNRKAAICKPTVLGVSFRLWRRCRWYSRMCSSVR